MSSFRSASLWHSFVAATVSTVVSIVFGSMAAYGMTRFGSNFEGVAFLVLALRMVPSAVLVIPFYLWFRNVDLLDSLIGLSVIGTLPRVKAT